MCKLGDIIVIKEFKNETGKIIKRHSFVVVNDNNGNIEGYDYNFICNMLCSFHNEEHKKRKLLFKENIEIKANIMSNNKINNKNGYIKADQLYYFNKKKIKYYVIAKLNIELQIKLLKLIFLLDNEKKLKSLLPTYNKEEYQMKKAFKLPKDFFIKKRPHKKETDKPEDMIPFKWPKAALNSKNKIIISHND